MVWTYFPCPYSLAPYFLSLLALKISLRNFFTTLLEGTRLLDFWVHYPTLPYSKLKNHYSLGPAWQLRVTLDIISNSCDVYEDKCLEYIVPLAFIPFALSLSDGKREFPTTFWSPLSSIKTALTVISRESVLSLREEICQFFPQQQVDNPQSYDPPTKRCRY